VWDLALGRLARTIDAHDHFVSCLTWGRTTAGATSSGTANGVSSGKEVKRRVNVLATGSVDQTIKVSQDWLRCFESRLTGEKLYSGVAAISKAPFIIYFYTSISLFYCSSIIIATTEDWHLLACAITGGWQS
jgi:hypothetical protein